MSDRRPIVELADVSENRLTWPPNKSRSASRSGNSPFKKLQIDREETRIRDELKRWRIARWLISRNHQRIFGNSDPGVAVWWENRHDKSLRVIACDHFRDMAANAHAVYLTMNALRSIERWRAYTGEEATEGARVLALPPPDDGRPKWWDVLGVDRQWPFAAIERVWKTLASATHPDLGGDGEKFAAINAAFDEAKKERGPQR